MQRRVEGLDATIADLVRRTRADLPVILAMFAEEATRDVRAAWPIGATGRSAAALTVTTGGGVVAIECGVNYATFIHEKGLRGPTYMVRIVDYVRRQADSIAARVSRRIAERR